MTKRERDLLTAIRITCKMFDCTEVDAVIALGQYCKAMREPARRSRR